MFSATSFISTHEQEIATLHGINPECDLTHPVPSPLVLKGTSTLYDADGKARMQWVKTRVDQERVEAAMRAAIEAMAEDIPRVEPISPPRTVADSLCNLYTLTDVHIGMRAWKPETGADWDLHIAERVLCGAFDHLIAGAPQAKVAVVNQGGDALHFDSLSAVTPTNNHLLDADELANLGESDIVFMLQRAREGLRNGDGVVRDGVTVGESVIVDSRGRPLAKEGSPEYEAMKILSERLGLRETSGPTVFSDSLPDPEPALNQPSASASSDAPSVFRTATAEEVSNYAQPRGNVARAAVESVIGV